MGTRTTVTGVALTFIFVLILSSAVCAEEVYAYRGFRLGMTVDAVSTNAGMTPGDATIVVQRPVLIQELIWRPPSAPSVTGAPRVRDSVEQVLFNFCDGGLYRIVVIYDRDGTEGMTEQDMIEALSATYGPTRAVTTRIITSSASQSYAETEPVISRWEDAQASVNLFHGTYRPTFGLVIFSKAQAPAARVGLETGLRLARLDAPRRELEEQKLRDEAERVLHAKAREANKVAFRY